MIQIHQNVEYPQCKQIFISTYIMVKNQPSWKKESRSSDISAKPCEAFVAASRAPLAAAPSCDLWLSASRFRSFPPPKIFWLSIKYWLGWLSEKLASSTCQQRRKGEKMLVVLPIQSYINSNNGSRISPTNEWTNFEDQSKGEMKCHFRTQEN